MRLNSILSTKEKIVCDYLTLWCHCRHMGLCRRPG